MSEIARKIVVPEGMLNAAYRESIKDADGIIRYSPTDGVRQLEQLGMKGILGAALAWLADNPIVPTLEQYRELRAARNYGVSMEDQKFYYAEWQRRMFIAPERHMIGPETLNEFCSRYRTIEEAVIEAFHRGRKLGGQP